MLKNNCLWVTLNIYQGLSLPFCKLMLALLKEVNCILLEVNIYKNLAINTIIFMCHYTIMIMLSFNNSRLIISLERLLPQGVILIT